MSYMKRSVLKCSKCEGNEFEVTVNYCVPRAIYLECKCGYITPIAVFDTKGKAYGVNGTHTAELYEESSCRDILPNEATKACYADLEIKKKEETGKSCDKWIKGRLGYNSENDRYGLLVSDLWENDGFHCGESLQVEIDNKWVDTRFEMGIDNEWYLVGTPYRGSDIEYITARILS